MAKTAFRKFIPVLAGVCAMFLATDSCTYDYFEDETNFRLYVPQIKNGEITDFYVSFHRLDGSDAEKHILTRKVSAPFTKALREDGILRFKLPAGEYEISTFADYASGSLTEGEPLSGSYKGVALLDPENNIYAMNATRPRALFIRNQQIWPLDHPKTGEIVTADIDESCMFKGEIVCRFIGLPERSFTSMNITYAGFSTRYDFDGVFRRFSDDDIHLHQDDLVGVAGGNLEISNLIYPSAGESHHARDASRSEGGEQFELRIEFYDGENAMGIASFTPADFEALDPSERPVDAEGNPLTELVLKPRDKITIIFKGFVFAGVDLVPWDDPNQGGIVIH